jgi:hypothetical protein
MRVRAAQGAEEERNVALRAADSRYAGDASVPRLTSETNACAAAYDQVGGGAKRICAGHAVPSLR